MWVGSHLCWPQCYESERIERAFAGRRKRLGTDVHICGGVRLHGDADVPRVRLLVLCGRPPPNYADIPLGARMRQHSFQKLLCSEERVTLVQKQVRARHVPSAHIGSVKPINASVLCSQQAWDGTRSQQCCTSILHLMHGCMLFSAAFPRREARGCCVVSDICRIECERVALARPDADQSVQELLCQEALCAIGVFWPTKNLPFSFCLPIALYDRPVPAQGMSAAST